MVDETLYCLVVTIPTCPVKRCGLKNVFSIDMGSTADETLLSGGHHSHMPSEVV